MTKQSRNKCYLFYNNINSKKNCVYEKWHITPNLVVTPKCDAFKLEIHPTFNVHF